MKYVMSVYDSVIPEKLHFFFALSRTHHGVLDMMAPVFAALLYLGRFPDPAIVVAGIITVFAGYTAVYALNDIAGYRDDKKNILPAAKTGTDLDSILIRHPLAQGVIGLKSAALWTGFWSVAALLGAFYLNPVCILIFLSGALLEIVYCFLLKISYLRVIVNGFVKSAGPVAAIFAVDKTPDALFLCFIFAFFFLWEAGGQNIPNDYTDMDEDRLVNAKTFPLVFGRRISCSSIMGLLSVSFFIMTVLFFISPVYFGWLYLLFGAGSLFLLILPARRLMKTGANPAAMNLFNKASYYPFFLLCVVLIALFL